MKTSKIFFMSDEHFGHKNYCEGVSDWENKEKNCRHFNTVEEMNAALIAAINSQVGEDDIIYDLGDWAFSGIENIWNFRKQINCKTIHHINGNHDQHIKNNKILPNCLWIKRWEQDKYNDGSYSRTLSEHNIKIVDILEKSTDYEYNQVRAKDLFTSVQNYLELKLDGQIIVLSHFPIQEWYEMDHGSIHLHGHCHHKIDHDDLNMFYRRKDVGLDDDFHIYSWDEIKEEMKDKKIKQHTS